MDVDALFREHHTVLERYLTRQCGDPELAADAVQETYLRLVERPPAHTEHVRAWLFTVATNVVREVARTGRRRRRLLLVGAGRAPHGDDTPEPDRQLEANERRTTMAAVLNKLTPRERTMLLMREEGFTHREIAEAVGVKPGSVGTLMVRALEKLEPDIQRLSREWS